jgi:hypothetical protein
MNEYQFTFQNGTVEIIDAEDWTDACKVIEGRGDWYDVEVWEKL